MEGLIFIIIAGVVGLIAGTILSRIILLKKTRDLEIKAREQADMTIKEAEISAEILRRTRFWKPRKNF